MIWVYASIGLIAVLFGLFFLENRRIQVTEETIELTNVRNPFRIVQVSDLHNVSFGKNQERLITKIKKCKPDYILVTGDLFNRKRRNACKNSFAFVREATKLCPVFFAEGNHECALKETGERYIDAIREMGVIVLRDEFIDLAAFRLIGLRQYAAPETLSAMLSKDDLNIVMAHRPELFPIYAGTGADVILSGHAHGGQFRIRHCGLYAPEQGLFPRYSEGLYQIGRSRLFVSRGLGNTVPVPRVFNTPELCLVSFKRKEIKDV
jgi:predicted MPP superfamily phosphohydrolase